MTGKIILDECYEFFEFDQLSGSIDDAINFLRRLKDKYARQKDIKIARLDAWLEAGGYYIAVKRPQTDAEAKKEKKKKVPF